MTHRDHRNRFGTKGLENNGENSLLEFANRFEPAGFGWEDGRGRKKLNVEFGKVETPIFEVRSHALAHPKRFSGETILSASDLTINVIHKLTRQRKMEAECGPAKSSSRRQRPSPV
ncbi:hypothetical protein MESS4_110180 [Mesorhizobium sp. STM 4661]|nr:hypothetical protein MESS4_110180 [Mesorhizobium sp. STM 4661]